MSANFKQTRKCKDRSAEKKIVMKISLNEKIIRAKTFQSFFDSWNKNFQFFTVGFIWILISIKRIITSQF